MLCNVLFTLDERWCCFLPTSGLGMVHSVPHTSCLPTIYPEIISSPTTIARQLITFMAAYKSSNIARIGSGSMCLHGTLYAYLFHSMFYYYCCYYYYCFDQAYQRQWEISVGGRFWCAVKKNVLLPSGTERGEGCL